MATDAIKIAWRKAIQKTSESTGDLNGNKISNKIKKVSKNSSQNTLKTVESETKTPKEIYILPEERQQVIEELRLI